MGIPNTSLKMTIGKGILSQISFQIYNVFTKCTQYPVKGLIFSEDILCTSYLGKWGQEQTLTLIFIFAGGTSVTYCMYHMNSIIIEV
jgi:hypothetical protein